MTVSTPPVHSPVFRNVVHCGFFFAVGLPLLLLVLVLDRFDTAAQWTPFVPYWIAGFLAAMTLFNAFILRHVPVFNTVLRPDEHWYNGVWLYPGALTVCFMLFPLYASFGAWAVLACGDAPASYFGRLLPQHRLPWNEKKSYAGFIAFTVFATGAAFLTLYLKPCPFFVQDNWPRIPYVWTLAILAAAAGALAESLDTPLDDNLRVPFAAGGALVAAAYFLKFSTQNLPEGTHVQPENLVRALLSNLLLGVGVLVFGVADFPAAALGITLGTLVFFYANWQGFVLLILFVALGSAFSKLGLDRKKADHTAEARDGKRGVGNVLANLALPALCCALYPLLHGRPSLLLGFAGAIAAALADTASSEIGVLSPHEPRLISTFKTVPHGTNGAVSLLGSFAACASSAIIAFASCATGFVQLAAGARWLSPWVLAGAGATIFLAGIVGTATDSFLGATLEGKNKFVGKGVVNFLCTLAGALLAGIAAEAWLFFA